MHEEMAPTNRDIQILSALTSNVEEIARFNEFGDKNLSRPLSLTVHYSAPCPTATEHYFPGDFVDVGRVTIETGFIAGCVPVAENSALLVSNL